MTRPAQLIQFDRSAVGTDDGLAYEVEYTGEHLAPWRMRCVVKKSLPMTRWWPAIEAGLVFLVQGGAPPPGLGAVVSMGGMVSVRSPIQRPRPIDPRMIHIPGTVQPAPGVRVKVEATFEPNTLHFMRLAQLAEERPAGDGSFRRASDEPDDDDQAMKYLPVTSYEDPFRWKLWSDGGTTCVS